MSTKTSDLPWRVQPPVIALGLITLLGLGLRFYALDAKTIWLDEAFSIWLAHQPLVDLWAWLIKIDQHPPLYYSLLHFWLLLFGDGQGPVRALSALCSGLAIPLFYGASRTLVGRRAALLAALLLAVSPFHVRYAQEARMYALLTLTAALALFTLALVLFDERARRVQWPWWVLALAQSAVMLTHNTATLLFPLALNSAIGGVWLWQQWQGSVSSLPMLNTPSFQSRWLRAQGLAIVGWLPWSIPFLIQAVVVDRDFWIAPPTVGLVYETLHNFNLAFLAAWSLPSMVINLSWWLLVALGVYARRQTPARVLLLITLFLLPIVGELLVSLRRPIFSDRTLIWVTLPYLMLMAAGIEEVGRVVAGISERITRQGRSITATLDHPDPRQWLAGSQHIVAVIGLSLMLGLNGLALYNYYAHFEKEEWAAAAAYVAEQVAPDELILFNATWVQLPFQYYFRHYEKTATLRGLPVDLFDRGVLEPKMSEADLPYLRNLLVDRESVWLIYSHDWYTDPHGLIPHELQQMLTLVEQRPFTGLQVMHFRRTP